MSIGGELVDREQRQQCPPQLEDREVVRIKRLRPAESPVEVPLGVEVLNAKGDDVRQRKRPSVHGSLPHAILFIVRHTGAQGRQPGVGGGAHASTRPAHSSTNTTSWMRATCETPHLTP